MKVVHLCLGAFYSDHYSYQENILPKYHKKLGYDTEVIASTQTFDEHGMMCFSAPVGTYRNEYGIKVTRLPYRSKNGIWRKLRRYIGVYESLNQAAPDILFIHNGQFLDMDRVVKYLKKHPEITVYVDNHADFSNSATNWLSRNILHKIIWKRTEHQIEPYTEKFYGVLPCRVEFLIDVYQLPAEKCELLVMGADDELIEKARKSGARERIRRQYGIKEEEILVMTGGKIDQWKTQTLLLMQAIHNIQHQKVRLIVFGAAAQELMDQVKKLADGTKVQYIGWITSDDTYDYFEAADLVVFPGRHSVLWEQSAGQGKPMIVKDWSGTHHVDLGGNVRFLKRDSAEEIQEEIERLLENPKELRQMAKIAQQKCTNFFSYEKISKRAITKGNPVPEK